MLKKSLFIILILLLIGGTVFMLGPRVDVDTTLHPVQLPEHLDQYLAQSEAKFTDITPSAEKLIIWADSSHTKTAVSIVYLHGYSATRQETAPVCDSLAKWLGANLFYTRLTGHGRGSAAMLDGTVNAWVNDANEAIEIGRRLGEKVILVGTSSGGTLATWMLDQPHMDDILAAVLISPNFGPKDPMSEVLLLPWAKSFVPLVNGDTYRWKPATDQVQKYWTTSYPTLALLPMMGLVDVVRKLPLEQIKTPVIVFYCPNDQIVNPDKMQAHIARFGSTLKKVVPIAQAGDPSDHVLAGDILSPENNVPILTHILDFILPLL